MFSDSEYNNTIDPYGINMDIDTILINATRIQASRLPHELWNQISINAIPSGDKSPLSIASSFLKDAPMILSQV
jgi:hypothetical protein